MKWIRRERRKSYHIRCLWLIKNFVDAKEEIFKKTKELNALPYDIPGTKYSRYYAECTFDFIIKMDIMKSALKINLVLLFTFFFLNIKAQHSLFATDASHI